MGLIRVLLALSVVFAHSPWHDGYALVGGRNAVQLFYMISGFLITHVLSTNKNYSDPIRFYVNRGLRIYPTYYAVAFLSLIPALRPHTQFAEFYHQAGATAGTLVAASNVTIFGQDWAMFGAIHDKVLSFAIDFRQSSPPLYTGLLIPQAWTLGLELTFYAIAPFLLRSNALIVAALTLSLAVRAYLMVIGIGTEDPWSYRFFPAELSLFLVGALANRFGLPIWKHVLATSRLRPVLPASVAFMALLILTYTALPLSEAVKTVGLMTIFAVLVPLTFLYQSGSQLDRRLGDLSYPIYIGHILMTLLVGMIWRGLHLAPNAAAVTFANIVAAIGFAFVLNRLLERPIEHLRSKVRRGQPMPST